MKAIVHAPGEGTKYSARGSAILFKAVGADTNGAFSFMEREIQPGSPKPPAHAHQGAEGFYVLDGTFGFEVGGDEVLGETGTFVLVPGRVRHTFGNAGSSPGRILIIHAPAADGYFADLQELWSGPQTPTPDDERELQQRHGWTTA